MDLSAGTKRRKLGQAAELRAAGYLADAGYTVIDRNWRRRSGELDIVARDGEWLVFVEVRARRGMLLGSPEESVTQRKQARLVHLAQQYLAECAWEGLWRIDVLALLYAPDGSLAALNHLRDVVGLT